jgi:hypothetical protein
VSTNTSFASQINEKLKNMTAIKLKAVGLCRNPLAPPATSHDFAPDIKKQDEF